MDALTVPHLGDDAIALRPPTPEDIEAIYAACQDPAIQRFTMVPAPYERAHAVEWIEHTNPDGWRNGTSAGFLVVDRHNGQLLGSCGLLAVDQPEVEIGYWVAREARGREIAVRAARLVSAWALADLGRDRVLLEADVANAASQRVADKAGFTRVGIFPAPDRCQHRFDTVVRYVKGRVIRQESVKRS